MTLVHVTIKGEREIDALLQKVFVGLQQPTDMLDKASGLILNRIRHSFLKQVDPNNAPWPRSGAAKKRGQGGRTLYDTGQLFRSIQLYKISPTERAIGTNINYAAEHNFGLEGQTQRIFLGLNDRDMVAAANIVIERIQELIE